MLGLLTRPLPPQCAHYPQLCLLRGPERTLEVGVVLFPADREGWTACDGNVSVILMSHLDDEEGVFYTCALSGVEVIISFGGWLSSAVKKDGCAPEECFSSSSKAELPKRLLLATCL